MALLAIEREICFNPICPLTFDYRLLAMAVLQPYSKRKLICHLADEWREIYAEIKSYNLIIGANFAG